MSSPSDEAAASGAAQAGDRARTITRPRLYAMDPSTLRREGSCWRGSWATAAGLLFSTFFPTCTTCSARVEWCGPGEHVAGGWIYRVRCGCGEDLLEVPFRLLVGGTARWWQARGWTGYDLRDLEDDQTEENAQMTDERAALDDAGDNLPEVVHPEPLHTAELAGEVDESAGAGPLFIPPTRDWNVADLWEPDYNQEIRAIDEDDEEALGDSLKKFGLVEDVVVNTRPERRGAVVGGNKRVIQARALGQRVIPCKEVDLDLEAEKELNARLNANGGRFNFEGLARHYDRDTLAAWGFRQEDRDAFDAAARAFEQAAGELGADDEGEDEVGGEGGGEAPRPKSTREAKADLRKRIEEAVARFPVEAGQVWEVGDHFVVCGSSKTFDVKTLGLGPDLLLLTDPPYCSGGFQEAGRAAGTWGDIASDSLSTAGYKLLLEAVLSQVRVRAGYLFTDWRMWESLKEVAEGAGLAVRSMIVWDKETPAMGGTWRPQHELVMFASRQGAGKITKAGLGNVIRCKRTGNRWHYTEKPVELLQAILQNDAQGSRGACPVVDTFGGSGSTLLACETLGRRCVSIDVEAPWCSVALYRWHLQTGREPVLRTA